jgi:ABC-2 type transport system permease protein
MWLKFKASTIKEFLLLIRDRAGLAMLFLMPMLLIFIMSLLQESTLKKLEERHTPVLIVNFDNDSLGINIVNGLRSAGFFEIHELIDGKQPSLEELKKLVNYGKYRVGIIVKEGASEALRKKVICFHPHQTLTNHIRKLTSILTPLRNLLSSTLFLAH